MMLLTVVSQHFGCIVPHEERSVVRHLAGQGDRITRLQLEMLRRDSVRDIGSLVFVFHKNGKAAKDKGGG